MNVELLNLLAQIATLVSVVIGIIGIWIGLRIYRRQMNAQILMAYTQRYELIMDAFPGFHLRFDTDNPPPESDELRLCILKYLNLSSEEFYMWRAKYVADEVWKVWEHELKRVLRSKLIEREWPRLRREFESYPEFLRFVEGVRSERKSTPSEAPANKSFEPTAS